MFFTFEKVDALNKIKLVKIPQTVKLRYLNGVRIMTGSKKCTHHKHLIVKMYKDIGDNTFDV